MSLARGLFVPNAPNLIRPDLFGGAGASTVAALRALELGPRTGVDAIVVATPHWESASEFLVHAGARPRQLYDFGGFPPALSEVRYAPPGHPKLARALVDAGREAGLPVRLTEEWGLDHGAWAPLMHLAPSAEVPVVPISVRPSTPAENVRWGVGIAAALSRVTERVAVVGTGSILHRLDRFGSTGPGVWPEGAQLESEIVALAVAGDTDAILRFDRAKWRTLAPEGNLAPLLLVMGAVGRSARAHLVHTDQVFGAAGMSILEFER